MRTVFCFFLFVLVAILEGQAHSVRSQQNARRRWRLMTYGGYRHESCLDRACPRGYDCRRQIRVTKSPVSRCLPDIRAAIQTRMDIYAEAFNRRDFQGVENLYTVNALITPSNSPLLRGRAGWGEFFAMLAAEMKWDKLTWILDTVAVGTDDFVSVVALFEFTSTEIIGESTFGKTIALWKRMRDVYEIDMFSYTFDK